jgi:hypothetical protein
MKRGQQDVQQMDNSGTFGLLMCRLCRPNAVATKRDRKRQKGIKRRMKEEKYAAHKAAKVDSRPLEDQLLDDDDSVGEEEIETADDAPISTTTKAPAAQAVRTFPAKKRSKVNSGHYVQDIG